MGIIARMFGIETRDAPPQDPYWSNFAAMHGIAAASPDNVLSNLAVAARCVALRSEMLASVPLFLFRRTPDGGRERADDLPLFSVLHDISNPQQSAYEFRELMVRSVDLYGNAYARIERNTRGQVTALWPMVSPNIQVELLPNDRLRYKFTNGRRTEILLQEDVLHIRASSHDGIMGQSPIANARGALSLALTQASTAQSLASNSLRPSGILSYPMVLDNAQKTYLRDQSASTYGGLNTGRMMVTDAGAKYETVSFTAEDSQFLEQRKLCNEDIARIFSVPPTSVGILDRGTYSNTEQESRTLVQNCIGPLAGRVEAAMHRCLLTKEGRKVLYVEHELDGLLRGDVKSRFDAYRLGRECGVYSPNDIRRKENEPPIANGDTYNQPANWMPLGAAPQGQGVMREGIGHE